MEIVLYWPEYRFYTVIQIAENSDYNTDAFIIFPHSGTVVLLEQLPHGPTGFQVKRGHIMGLILGDGSKMLSIVKPRARSWEKLRQFRQAFLTGTSRLMIV